MAKPLEPPEILAELCAIFHLWEERGWLEPRVAQAEAVLKDSTIWSGMEETRLGSEWARLSGGLSRIDGHKSPGADRFYDALKLLQALDRWHEPLSDPIRGMTFTQDSVRTRFKIRDPKDDIYSYNRNVEFGLIIPPWAQAEGRPSSEMSILAGLLIYTAYLPAEVRAGNANRPTKVGGRRLRVRYRALRARLPVSPGDDTPIIALAPVLESRGHARIAVNDKAKVYGVSLHYDWERMGRIFDAAFDSGARILLLPEMTVRHADAPRLLKLFKDKLLERRRATREDPSLFYVIAGLVAGRDGDGASGTNEVVLFHALQNEASEPFLRQAKLCRWNLDKPTQEDFINRVHCKRLNEDIKAGGEIYVADLDGLGRTLTLICADMEANEPGHWLIKNIGVDWLYAPIMDRSISHRIQIDPSGAPQLRPWVVDRAAIAVKEGAMRAVVVNSFALTLLNNESDAIRPYLPFDKCGWAFMIDGSGGQLRYKELVSKVPADADAEPLVCAVRWLDDFQVATPPMA